MIELDIKFYVKKIKEHDAQRLSTNARMAFWKEYFTPKRTETSFDMSKF